MGSVGTLKPVAGGRAGEAGEADDVDDVDDMYSPARLRVDACKAVDHVTRLVETSRRDLAYLYARAVGGTDVEQEIGECLALLRKAERRLLEAYTELAQQELPLG